MLMNISYELEQRLDGILGMLRNMSTLKRRAPISEKKEEFCKLRDLMSHIKENYNDWRWYDHEIECLEHYFTMHCITRELKKKNRCFPKSIKILFDEIYEHLLVDSTYYIRWLEIGDDC